MTNGTESEADPWQDASDFDTPAGYRDQQCTGCDQRARVMVTADATAPAPGAEVRDADGILWRRAVRDDADRWWCQAAAPSRKGWAAWDDLVRWYGPLVPA